LFAVKEMHRQVGELVLDEEGCAVRGLLVRHLVLPGSLAGTEKVLQFIAEEMLEGLLCGTSWANTGPITRPPATRCWGGG
jgi:uncharacterized Fe-S radical SAM superfamily protein PflX